MEYHFVRVPVDHRSGAVPSAALQRTVHALAAEGWRLVQVMVEVPAVMPMEYLVIAERDGPPPPG